MKVRAENGPKFEGTTLRYIRLRTLKIELEPASSTYFT